MEVLPLFRCYPRINDFVNACVDKKTADQQQVGEQSDRRKCECDRYCPANHKNKSFINPTRFRI